MNPYDIGNFFSSPPHPAFTVSLLTFSPIQSTAIWDNRTVFHSAIMDFAGMGPRTGHRAVGIGERPYFDPNSKTRQEALEEEARGLA